MKRTTIREFRSNIAEIIGGDESVLVTRHGKPAALVYPLGNPEDVPLELRRKLYLALATDVGKDLEEKGISDEQIERDFAQSKQRRRGQ
jgi:antitoxin (DNA-binding transcriptional repressor) of toxin-antitoxin stability system